MKTLKVIGLVVLLCTISSPAFADCMSSEECIEDYAMTGIGKINNTLRAVFFELQETNRILKEEDTNHGASRREH